MNWYDRVSKDISKHGEISASEITTSVEPETETQA